MTFAYPSAGANRPISTSYFRRLDWLLVGAALGVRHGIEWLVARKRIQRMQDAEIEHEWYADQLRR